MRFSVYQVSRRGGRRKNEDRMGYCYTREAGLFLLADGMGGHPEGEVAAQLALKEAAALFEREASPRVADAPAFLVAAMQQGHHSIQAYARARHMQDTPRTTLVAALVQDGQIHWLHCGDSRFYLMRDGALLARTQDHSMAARFSGSLNRMVAINRNVLYTCLGSASDPEYDLGGPVPLVPGDKLLLCSDGFWGNVEEERIVSDMALGPVAHSVPELVELALRQGGDTCDNVTVLAFDWEPRTPESPGDVVTHAAQATEFASTLMADSGLDVVDDDLPAADADPPSTERPADGSVSEIEDARRHDAGRKD